MTDQRRKDLKQLQRLDLRIAEAKKRKEAEAEERAAPYRERAEDEYARATRARLHSGDFSGFHDQTGAFRDYSGSDCGDSGSWCRIFKRSTIIPAKRTRSSDNKRPGPDSK